MGEKQIGVVIQLSNDSPEVQKATIAQIHNLLNAIPGILIELVIHSKGISLVLNNSTFRKDIENLVNNEVSLKVCKNTMTVLKLQESDLLPLVTIVPSAVAYIVFMQQQGWSYLKAGF